MNCNKCGSKIDEGSKFCPNCGTSVENGFNDNYISLNNYQQNNSNQQNDVNTKNKGNDKLGLFSLIIGIISIILAILIKPFALILGICGLIIGLVSKNKDKKRKIGIILNIISIVIRIITLILALIGVFALAKNPEFLNRLYNELDYSTSDNYIAGTWNCSKFDGTGVVGDYTITMKLNKDNSFIFGEYGDLDNNHAGGTYTYEDEKEKNETVTNGYKYYIINITGKEGDYIIDGVQQDRTFEGKFEMGITSVNAQKQAILMNYYTYQMYACYLEK